MNSFLYGISVDIFNSLNDIEFREDDSNLNLRGEMYNRYIYGIKLNDENKWDVKYERHKEYYSSLVIEGMPFLDSSSENIQDMVLEWEQNRYRLTDGKYPISFEQKSISTGWQLLVHNFRFIVGFVYRKDDEDIFINGNLVTTKKDNIGVKIELKETRMLDTEGEPTDQGYGFWIDNVEYQMTKVTNRLAIFMGYGYKYDNSLIYFKYGGVFEENNYNTNERYFVRGILGYKETF